MTQSKIKYFEPTAHAVACAAKVNGMDIAGDYLYAVGTYSYMSLYQHRFWSIKVYQRNHNTGGLAKRIAGSDVLPEGFAIKASPNPFNSAVNLIIDLPDEMALSLKIIDLNGREVETVAEGKYARGNHKFFWNGENNPSGLYFAVLSTGEKFAKQKLLLVK